MNCPNCPSALTQPEGGMAYCDSCGWGNRDWFIKLYNETCERVGELQNELTITLASLAHSKGMNAGLAIRIQDLMTPKARQRQVNADRAKKRGLKPGDTSNMQLFCQACGKGVGDEQDRRDGWLKNKCPRCDAEGPFLYSYELWGDTGIPNGAEIEETVICSKCGKDQTLWAGCGALRCDVR